MDLLKLSYAFVKVVLSISRPLPNKTKLIFDQDAKLVEVSALNKRCRMSQSTQCLGSIVPLEMFQPKILRSTIKSQTIIYTLTGLTTMRESNPSK